MQTIHPANGTEKHTEWPAINWRKANRVVRNLRQRIFRASTEGDLQKARSLQKLMLRSYSNILVSVRRVTQINDGKHTAGVDKVVIKTPAARGKLIDELTAYTPWKAKPARRAYIPKINGTPRPLSIPVVADRCLQAMVKNALEPFWEARFEGSSYGFRPGRGCHDAIVKIQTLAQSNGKKQWLLDADLKGAFDNISHSFLLNTVGSTPGRELIKQWLKAGYVEDGVLQQTEAGTPQGGVVSPLLLNIALHGIEEALTVRKTLKNGKTIATTHGVKYHKQGWNLGKRAVVKYADDFVVFCETKEDAEKSAAILTEWLKDRGLVLSPAKTKIVNLSEGFNFLGFNVRRYKNRGTKTGQKLLIKPSKESVQKIRKRLREEWRLLRGHSVSQIIRRLNPIIRGWANYFRIGVANEVFRKLDHWVFIRTSRYVRQTHPRKPWSWMKEKYWGRMNLARRDNWVIGDKRTGQHLLKFSWFPIERHTLVRGAASPDDASLEDYWAQRSVAKARDLVPSRRKLAEKQKGRCLRCGESLFNGEEIQVHHAQWKSRGGGNTYGNLQLVHLFCHQQIHTKSDLCAQ